MEKKRINDTLLIKLIDKEHLSQSAAARKMKVSRQAVSKRLMEIRGRQTKIIATKKLEESVDRGFDAIDQLLAINKKTHAILDAAASDADLALKALAEIRQQLKLASDLYSQMYSIKVVNEFMTVIADILKDVDDDVYREFQKRFNNQRSIRPAVRLN